MPAQEVNQPQVQQMDIPQADAAQQPVCLSPHRPGHILMAGHMKHIIANTVAEAC